MYFLLLRGMMDHLSQHQVTDLYLISIMTVVCVVVFVFLKRHGPWSQEIWLVYSIGGWAILESTALTLFFIGFSQKAKLPQILSTSIYIILATISLWGVAILQIIAILYPFASIIRKEEWWKWLIILEGIEVALVVALALVPRIPTPLELVYITPITSQVTVAGALLLAYRELSAVSFESKRIAEHLLLIGLFALMLSATVIGLSLAGYYTTQMLDQWLFYMAMSAAAYRLPSHQPNGNLELGLAPTHGVGEGARPPHARNPSSNSSRSLLGSQIAIPTASMAGSNTMSV